MTEIDSIITTELQKFDVSSGAIASMEELYMPLTIKDVDDKEGFDKVHEARMKVKGIRVDVEKRRVELKEDSLKYGRAVDGEAKRITALLAPIEAHLEAQEKKITEEKERIKEEEKRKEREKMEDRVKKLTAYNARIFTPLLEKMTDEEFEKELAVAKENFEREEKRLAQIEADKKAEAERVAKQKEEQDKKEEELKKKEAELQAQQEKIDAEKKALEQEKTKREFDAEYDQKFSNKPEIDIPTNISTPLEKAQSEEVEEVIQKEPFVRDDVERKSIADMGSLNGCRTFQKIGVDMAKEGTHDASVKTFDTSAAPNVVSYEILLRLGKLQGDSEAYHGEFDDILEEKLMELVPEWMETMVQVYRDSKCSRWCA